MKLEPEAPGPESNARAENLEAEHFYSGALARITQMMIVLAVILTLGAWWRFGYRIAIGFAFGCGIAYINFHWLARVVSAFVDRATGTDSRETGQGIVFRFLFRYVLMAVGAYVILTVSPASLKGLLAGLFLPVAAILCEAVHEAYAALTRGI